MQRITLYILVSLIALSTALACAQKPGDAESAPVTDQVVARIGGEPVTASELEEAIGSQMMKLRQQVYQTKLGGLKKLAFDRLVEAAAQAAEMSRDDYYKQEVTDKAEEPAEEQVTRTINQYRARLPQDDDQAREQVLGFLNQQAMAIAEEALRKRLFAENKVEFLLEPPRAKATIQPYNPARGPEDAPVTMIEYTDFQCPYCSRVQGTIRQVMSRYDGHIRHVFKHLPLPMHQNAPLAAEASLCAADQGNFWQLHDLMFKKYSSLNRELIDAQATELGLDMTLFADCLEKKVHAEHVKTDTDEARGFGITGTPGFLINGQIITGAQPYENFVEIINDELKRAGVEIPAEPEPAPVESQADDAGEAKQPKSTADE